MHTAHRTPHARSPDKWKEGSSNTIEGGGRKLNANKLLDKSKK
jgi:hypothetical protein